MLSRRSWPRQALGVGLVGLLLVSGCTTDSIADRRRGQQLVCHDGVRTLAVSNADSFVHLDHGDTAGPCPAGGS